MGGTSDYGFARVRATSTAVLRAFLPIGIYQIALPGARANAESDQLRGSMRHPRSTSFPTDSLIVFGG